MKAYRFTLADDDPNVLFFMHRMLSLAFPASSIATFSNAEDALSHILHSGADILITDHGIGHMDGAQLIRELRARKSTIPIVMISGNPNAKKEAFAAGATEFLDKNTDQGVLESHIRSLVQQWG